MFGRIGLAELIFIFLVVFLLFGAKAMPEIAKGLAKAIKIFKREMHDIQDSLSDEPSQQATAAAVEKIKDHSNDYDPSVPKRDWRSESGKEAVAGENREEV
ncbi:MAG: twin-arginine translocase TatA/TatE family subunit [Candidatus Omnitrophica bacterium]|nr:twin-arginine translocase TatA/TatE family subunit [Candidatus Omnitrophota bacterium]